MTILVNDLKVKHSIILDAIRKELFGENNPYTKFRNIKSVTMSAGLLL